MVMPLVVGFPSGDTQGMLSTLGEFFGAEVPVFAVVALFEPFLCLFYSDWRGNDHGVAWFPVGGGSYFVFVCCLQGIYQP